MCDPCYIVCILVRLSNGGEEKSTSFNRIPYRTSQGKMSLYALVGWCGVGLCGSSVEGVQKGINKRME